MTMMVLMVGKANGQQLTFDSRVWDFGTIREVDGKVCHTFTATSSATEPIVIERVYTSCGCTTTDYPNKPIAPNGKIEIKACFDPTGRPGEFCKNIDIVLNGSRRETIAIKGTVEPRPRSVEDDYPFYMAGGLRIDRNSFGLGTVQHGEAESTVVQYINTSECTIRPRVVFQRRSGLLEVNCPKSIAPGEKGQMTLTYNLLDEESYYGRMIDKFAIEVDGKTSEHTIYVAAIAVDNIAKIDHETAPSLTLSCRMHDFGEVEYGTQKTYSHRVTLTNSGTDPLIIRWVENKPEQFFITLRPASQIKGGESLTFEMTLKPDSYNTAEIFDAVSIITNDPIRPYTQIKARARIKSN